MKRVLGTTTVVLLAALLVWVPLPFASVTRLGATVLQTAAFVALALALLGKERPHRRDKRGWFGTRAWPVAIPALALGGIALLGLVQSAAWSRDLVISVSPEHGFLQERTAGLLAPYNRSAAATLSIAPSESRSAALVWAAVAACFAAAGLSVTRRSHRRLRAAALAATALFQVLYGTSSLGTGLIWGVDVRNNPGRLRGTFVNPDHFAVYLELALAVSFAWGWWAVRRLRQAVSAERGALLLVPPLLLWPTLFVGLAYTGSRAGMVAAVFAILVQAFVVARAERSWRVGLWGSAAILAGLAVVGAIGLQQGLGRWMATSSHELTWNNRFTLYEEAFGLWLRFPWLGTGLGTFREAFPLVQPAELPMTWEHAHNDVLELLVTTGVLGTTLFMAGLLVVVHRLARLLSTGAIRSEERAAALAALGALSALAVHSWFDFGLSMPANAATLAVLCGASVGATPRVGAEDHG